MTTQNISDSEIPPAKARRAPSSARRPRAALGRRADNYFLCGLGVFAGDIPILLVAASQRYVNTPKETLIWPPALSF